MTVLLDAIRARAAAAMPGPWRLEIDHCDCNDGLCSHGAFPYALRLPVHTVPYTGTPCDPDASAGVEAYKHTASDIADLTMETAEFIAHARTDVPVLLAEIDRRAAEPDLLHAARRIAYQLGQRSEATKAGHSPLLTQALKVAEEAGELAEAVNGTIGENPRKGFSHSVADCLHEALDVALAALVFGYRVEPERFHTMLSARLDALAQRAAESGAPPVPSEVTA